MAEIFRHRETRHFLGTKCVPAGTPGARRVIKESRLWHCNVNDGAKVRRVALCEDKIDALRMRTELLEADNGDRDYLTVLPRLTIDEHIADFKRHLTNKGDSLKHVDMTIADVKAVLVGARCLTLAALHRITVEDWLAEKRDAGWSARTSNRHLTAIKSFTRWLARREHRRISHDPLVKIPLANTKIDRRLTRRMIDHADFAKLLAAAKAGAPAFKVTGDTRAVLYTLAAHTGLTAKEIAELRPLSFDLAAVSPTVTVQSRGPRPGTINVLPLRADVANLLKPVIAGRELKKPLWPGRWKDRAAEMLQVDLAAAGIPYVDEAGEVFDFHALRHYFITNIVRGGVHPKLCQRLARHASINTTMDYYGDVQTEDKLAALDTLPAIP